ncbi:helix-turn-helix domain-containing protein [Acinetobacter sp. YH16058]
MRHEALKLHVMGFNPTRIAKELGVSRPSVYKWVTEFTNQLQV